MKSYFKFLSRNKLYTAIEAFGLSIALAFVMILVSYAFMEYRVGTHQPDAKNLYVRLNPMMVRPCAWAFSLVRSGNRR